jgi:anti-sigma28 factor (negative regulator of flagellin synthesis)
MANSIPGIGGSSSSQQIDILKTAGASKHGIQSASKAASDPVASTQIGVATDLSNLGTMVATAAKRAIASSAIRPEVVASLKAKIAAGTYHPDPDAVAARVAAAIRS